MTERDRSQAEYGGGIRKTGPEPASQLDDPRVYLAVERTFLSWIRTGLALMGFGFVVARFGLFLQELYAIRPTVTPPGRGISVRVGTALVCVGAVLTVSALLRYFQLLRRLDRGERLTKPSRSAVALALVLAAMGTIMTAYLLQS